MENIKWEKWIFALLSMGILLLSACGDIGSGKITISVADTAKEYETMSCGEFKRQTGNEAEFYHADRFISEIQIQFDSDKDGELDRQLLISLDEVVEETIRPEYITWLELL